jgi:hypothetical protein
MLARQRNKLYFACGVKFVNMSAATDCTESANIFHKIKCRCVQSRNTNQLKYFAYELHSIENQPLSQEQANYSLWRYCCILECSDIAVGTDEFFCLLMHYYYYNRKKN